MYEQPNTASLITDAQQAAADHQYGRAFDLFADAINSLPPNVADPTNRQYRAYIGLLAAKTAFNASQGTEHRLEPLRIAHEWIRGAQDDLDGLDEFLYHPRELRDIHDHRATVALMAGRIATMALIACPPQYNRVIGNNTRSVRNDYRQAVIHYVKAGSMSSAANAATWGAISESARGHHLAAKAFQVGAYAFAAASWLTNHRNEQPTVKVIHELEPVIASSEAAREKISDPI